MLFKNINIIFFLALALCFSAKAQKAVVPGYQGKRFFAGISLGLAPAVRGFNSKGSLNSLSRGLGEGRKYGKKNPLVLSGHYGLEVGYAVWRRVSISASFGLGKTGFEEDVEFKMGTGNGIQYRYVLYTVQHSHATLGFEFVRKKKWGLAPVGPYWGMKLMYIQAKEGEPAQIWELNQNDNKEIATDIADCDDCRDFDPLLGDRALTAQIILGNRSVFKGGFYVNVGATMTPLGWSWGTQDSPISRVLALYGLNGQVSVGRLF